MFECKLLRQHEFVKKVKTGVFNIDKKKLTNPSSKINSKPIDITFHFPDERRFEKDN